MPLRLVLAPALVLAAIGAAAVSAASADRPARAAQDIECVDRPLGPAVDDWNLIIHGDLIESDSDSEGRIAVGGDATLTNFGVADTLPNDATRVDLAVGGTLNATNVGVNHGSITYGGSLNGNATAPVGTITQQPLDLDAAFQEAQRRAAAWAELDPNGTVSGPENQALSLTGDDATLNVFRVSAARLQSAPRLLIRVPFGSSILVTVTGDAYSTATQPYFSMEFWTGSGYQQFGDQAPNEDVERLRRSMLWNFPGAETLTIGPNLAWHGSILAPRAAMLFPSGQINGTVIAASLSGDGESHLHVPDLICLPDPGIDPPPEPTPEPSPTPEPTPEPSPAPTPTPEGTPPPFDTEQPPSEGGTLPGADTSTNFDVIKQVIDRRGRRVNLIRARPGQLVRFRLWGYNLGFSTVRDVRACDRIPAGLRLVRAPGDPTVRNGRICWRIPTVDTQRQAIVTFRVRRRVCGRIVNRLTVRSDNGGKHSDTAHVSACRRIAPRLTG